eukprot:TRINITY_DN1359_c0_g1_i3.p1 TRINITY_DN1359_c0_g1~~TRINITY_DN1359_c0_g1_i3.p1  ORF type:complete len:257 (+),score=36.59 TRINITY_DN1359_c0_g1_i3:119-889(+)
MEDEEGTAAEAIPQLETEAITSFASVVPVTHQLVTEDLARALHRLEVLYGVSSGQREAVELRERIEYMRLFSGTGAERFRTPSTHEVAIEAAEYSLQSRRTSLQFQVRKSSFEGICLPKVSWRDAPLPANNSIFVSLVRHPSLPVKAARVFFAILITIHGYTTWEDIFRLDCKSQCFADVPVPLVERFVACVRDLQQQRRMRDLQLPAGEAVRAQPTKGWLSTALEWVTGLITLPASDTSATDVSDSVPHLKAKTG